MVATRLDRLRFLLGACLFFALGTRGQAQERELHFPDFARSTLLPWFDSQADQFVVSAVKSDLAVQLRYRSFIHPEALADVTIVHGFNERIEKFAELAYDLHQAGFNVHLYDQRGFGRSSRVNPKAIKAAYVERFTDYADDLERFLTTIVGAPHSTRPSFVFAHSMGGLVTSLVLQKRPDLVTGAVLSAPMLAVKIQGIPKKIAIVLTELADEIGLGPSYIWGQGDPRKPHFDAKTPTQSYNRWQVFADFYASPNEWDLAVGGSSFHWLGEALRASKTIESQAWSAAVGTPILLFQAEQDIYVDNQAQDIFCERVQDCRKIFVPGTRHEIYREGDFARVAYLASILQFFTELSRQGKH